MRIGILACDILKNEIELHTKDDPDVTYREYLEFALHEDPENMRRVIVEKVNELVGKVDALFLGYAICSSLRDIDKILPVPTVMLPGADCIDALLGTSEYDREKKICPGTWFMTPGWAIEGKQGLIKEMHLDCMEDFPPEMFMEILFESYQRVLFIDSGVGDADRYRKMSEAFAEELKLKHDCRCCGTEAIKVAFEKTKELARSLV